MIREYTRPAPLKDILEEHTEEAAFMYNCRIRTFIDPERSWEDLRNYEIRMLPHLHSLALGGFHSAKILKEKLILKEDGDPGETFVATTVYPMLDLIEPMQWLIDAIAQKLPHLMAIIDGLKFTNGKDIEGWLNYFLEHENPAVRSVGAEVSGYSRLTILKDKLSALTEDTDRNVSMSAIYSLASMGIMPEKNMLTSFLNNHDPALTLKAVELLLRMGSYEAVAFCRQKSASVSEFNREVVYFLSIAGNLQDSNNIIEIMNKQPVITKECLLALGLCGNVESMDMLIAHLDNIDNPETFAAAYQGLRLITGADYLPQFDPEEVTPKEILGYQDSWKDWWDQNRKNFPKEFKWRRGEKISPSVLYKDLLWTGNPCRNITYLEMVIRYNCPVDFQYDQFYTVQVQQLQRLRQWAEKEDSRLQHGLPYYHGKPLN